MPQHMEVGQFAGYSFATKEFVHKPSMAHPPAICKTGKCNLERLEDGSKVKLNIGNHDFWVNNLKRSRPQDVVVLDNEQNGKFNRSQMEY